MQLQGQALLNLRPVNILRAKGYAIWIPGTGIVGQTLGLKLVQLGHSVMLDTRDPAKLDETKGYDSDVHTLRDWLAVTGSQGSVGTFSDAAAFGDLVINAIKGAFLGTMPKSHW